MMTREQIENDDMMMEIDDEAPAADQLNAGVHPLLQAALADVMMIGGFPPVLEVTKLSYEIFDNDRVDYEESYESFAKPLKYAVTRECYDGLYLSRLEELLFFDSTLPSAMFGRSSLAGYISGRYERLELDDSPPMYPHTLRCLFYLPAVEGYHAIGDWLNSPFIERFTEEKVEVLYLRDRHDLFAIERCADLASSRLMDVSKGGILKRYDSDEEYARMQLKFSALCVALKKILVVDEVVVSRRLVQSSACYLVGPPTVFEINPSHELIDELRRKLYAGKRIDLSAVFLYEKGHCCVPV